MYLFNSFDEAILQATNAHKRFSHSHLVDRIETELKLAILFSDEDRCIVFPATFFYESAVCREIIKRNIKFVESGFIKILSSSTDFDDFREKKKDSYSNVRRVQCYQNAYYKTINKNHGIKNIPFQIIPKNFNPGGRAHKLWVDNLTRQDTIFSENMWLSFLDRFSKNDTGNSTWESVEKQLNGFNFSTFDAEQLKKLSITTYLAAHRECGISVITGSTISPVSYIGHSNGDIDTSQVIAKMHLYDVIDDFKKLSGSSILLIKSSAEFNRLKPFLLQRGAVKAEDISTLKSLFKKHLYKTILNPALFRGLVMKTVNYNNIGGTVGSLGENPTSTNTFYVQENGNSNQLNVSDATLTSQLNRLIEAASNSNPSSTEAIVLDQAKNAINNNKLSEALNYLKSGGSWLLNLAKEIGVPVAIEAIKKSSGI